MSDAKTYSANEVSCHIGGISIDSGRGDDEFIAIAKAEDTVTVKVGVDGELTRSIIENEYTTVTLTLMATSKGNDIICALHLADRLTKGGVVPMKIQDKLGRSVLVSIATWVTKMPDQSFAKEVGTIQWVFGVHEPKRFVGGHST